MSEAFSEAVGASMRNVLPWVHELETDKFDELTQFVATSMDRSFNNGMDYAKDEAWLRDAGIIDDD